LGAEELPEAGPPHEFDEFTLVLLYRGLNPPVLEGRFDLVPDPLGFTVQFTLQLYAKTH